jgi:hypothetical protein
MDPRSIGRERHLLSLPPLDEDERAPETLDEPKLVEEGEESKGEPS